MGERRGRDGGALMRDPVVLGLLFGLAGWAVALFLLGIRIGESHHQGQFDQQADGAGGKAPRARVNPPSGKTPRQVAAEMEDAREKYVRECEAEGYSRKDALADYEAMMRKVTTDASPGAEW